nr:glycosyl hydrolase family 8 [Roseomonas rosulenta]
MPPTAPRRWLLAALPAAFVHPRAAAAALPDWRLFAERFLRPDGRIIDTGNAGVSHSEGQGWGLMLAAVAQDRDAFERIRAWTRRVLKRPHDHLHAWRYRPGATPAIDDPNNATDGDLYIAWGLLLGAQLWRVPGWEQEAVAIGQDILRLTLRQQQGRALLLPGAAGFESAAGLVLNPSYIAIPAFAALARAMPQSPWPAIARDGTEFLRRARFGAWGLSPDWVLQPPGSAPLRLPQRWPPRFSFDAVRVPLLLAWGGDAGHPAVAAAAGFWTDSRWPAPPAYVDLVTGEPSDFQASPGVRAIASFVVSRRSGNGIAVTLPSINESRDYYSASLTLLVRFACLATGTPVA